MSQIDETACGSRKSTQVFFLTPVVNRYITNGVSLSQTSHYISILQTKFSDREGHEARRVGLKAVPLDQHIEGGHGECQARLNIPPAPMHHLLQMADECQHREHRLHEHTILPLAPRTQFEIRGIALGRMEAGITQDNHLLLKWPNQPLKGLVCDLGGITRPPHD